METGVIEKKREDVDLSDLDSNQRLAINIVKYYLTKTPNEQLLLRIEVQAGKHITTNLTAKNNIC